MFLINLTVVVEEFVDLFPFAYRATTCVDVDAVLYVLNSMYAIKIKQVSVFGSCIMGFSVLAIRYSANCLLINHMISAPITLPNQQTTVCEDAGTPNGQCFLRFCSLCTQRTVEVNRKAHQS